MNFKKISSEKRGILFAWVFASLEGLFPILSIFILKSIGSIYAYTFSITIAMILFMIYLSARHKLHELFCRNALYDLLMTAFLINLMFVLIFIGLRFTTAGNMSVIIIMQLFFAYLYFNIFGPEKLGTLPTIGALIMAVGGVIVVFPEDFSVNIGDFLILFASAIAPIGNLYQKRARNYVSSETILAFRYAAAIPILLGLAYLFENNISKTEFLDAAPFILLNGILVFTLAKILWIEALHFTSITKLSAMVSLIPVFTLTFAYLIFGDMPTPRQLMGIVSVILGSMLISQKEQREQE